MFCSQRTRQTRPAVAAITNTELASRSFHFPTGPPAFVGGAHQTQNNARLLAVQRTQDIIRHVAERLISHYRLLSELGRGGMGVIYRAQDIRLNRDVALKLLSDSSLADQESIQRFQREALAASALNHPHICTVYEVGEDQGTHFISMELIEGHTLAETLLSGPLALQELLRLGIQIADALEAAHKKRIVHRDLKPSNIFVTSRGDAKLLDFGLAKELCRESAATADAATISAAMTIRGQVLGTVAYMSPEQAQGKEVDARSDIFSFGAVLYEMATARKAFSGESAATIFAEILRSEPGPASTVNPRVPQDLERVISKALEKARMTDINRRTS